jgi:hypothetical protein
MKRKIFAVVMTVAMMTMATASMCFAADSTGTAQIVLNAPASSNIDNQDPTNIDYKVTETITVNVADSSKAAATVTDLSIQTTSTSKEAIDVTNIVANAGTGWSLASYSPNTFTTYNTDDNKFAMQVNTILNNSGQTAGGTAIDASATPNADMSPSGYAPASTIMTVTQGSQMTVRFDGLVTKTSVAQNRTNIGTCVVTVAKTTIS